MVRRKLAVCMLAALSSVCFVQTGTSNADDIIGMIEGKYRGSVGTEAFDSEADAYGWARRGPAPVPRSPKSYLWPPSVLTMPADVTIQRMGKALLLRWDIGSQHSNSAFVVGKLGTTQAEPPIDSSSFDLRCEPDHRTRIVRQVDLECTPASTDSPQIAARMSLRNWSESSSTPASAMLDFSIVVYEFNAELADFIATSYSGRLPRRRQ